jgi:hypothetical protein
MSAWTNPADGYSRSLKFQYNGLGWVEVSRTPADVPMPSTVPADIADCVLWLRADSLSLSDTDPVASWGDESGEGNNFVQATGGNKPLYRTGIIGGQPAVVFDGTDDFMTAPHTASLNITSPHTCFFVLKLTSLPPGDRSFCLFQKGAMFNLRYKWYVNQAYFLNQNVLSGGNVLSCGSPTPLAVDTPYLYCAANSTSEHWEWVNGVHDEDASLVDPNFGYWGVPLSGTDEARLGGFSDLSYYYTPMSLCEMVLYDRELEEDERLQLEQYFARKYGLSIGEAYE